MVKLRHDLEFNSQGSTAVHASNLQAMVKLYERIQGYIFRLMATDSIPKFIKTERFLVSLFWNVRDSGTDEGCSNS